MRYIAMRNSKGFTLIELISVIIILGILASVAVGLFATKDNFASEVVKNQLISSLRLSQQLALGRQNLSTSVPVTLIVGQSSGDWTFDIWDSAAALPGNAAYDTANIEIANTSIRVTTSDFSSACSAISSSTNFSVSFDGDGNLLSGGRVRLCVIGDQTSQVCISSLGFAYAGSTCL